MYGTGRAPSLEAEPATYSRGSNGLEPERVSRLQRARILAAMAEVCAARGASNVTVAHVVSCAGVSRRTFYEIFESRDDCFLATLEEALESVARYVLPAYRAPSPWNERIRASLVALLRFLEDDPFVGRLLVVETLGAGLAALERRKRALACVLAAVDEGRTVRKDGKDVPPLTAEGVVGGALSVIHTRLVERGGGSLLDLAGPLMSMIVLPYLGTAAANRELQRPAPAQTRQDERPPLHADPLRDVRMRLTYRTVRVLTAIASRPGSSNREIGLAAGIQDQGQASRLLIRLAKLDLIQNSGAGWARGSPNAWALTKKGAQIQHAIHGRAGG